MKKFILGLLFVVAGIAAQAQVKDLLSVYSITRDTVVNTATITLTSPRVTGEYGTVIQVNVTKISGTVGGTITIQGSLDGQNFKALTTPDTQTALATATATDATNSYLWRLSGVPYPYYRVSYTGTGTMSASFTAKIQAK